MRRFWILLPVLALLLAALPAVASAATQRPIVYLIVIDGLDGDRVDAGKAPFISSMLAGQGARSTYYRESRSVMIAETNPNHSAMVTGAYGDSSGIPGNSFALYAPTENEDSCALTGPVDETKAPTVTSGENSNCLQAQTVFEAVKRQGNPDGLLTAGVFGKPKLGRIFAGRKLDGRTPDADYITAPCSSGADDDDYCTQVPTNPVTGYAVDDRTTMDLVLRTVREGVGPARRRPDFTFVNLPQVDSAGHATGTGSGAYDAAIGQADDEIERLVGELRARGEWGRTVMILLSDHSMDTTLTKTTLSDTLSSAGIPDDQYVAVQNGSVDAVYLANRKSPGRFELLKRMRAAALANPNVAEAFYRESNPADGGAAHTLAGARPGWRLAAPRSGDLVVTTKAGAAFSDPSFSSNPIPGNHGGPQTRDNFLAVVGGGPFVRQALPPGTPGPLFDDTLQNPMQAENVDPAPTAMGLLGLFPPKDSAGRFLTEAFDVTKLPGGGAPALRPRVGVKRIGRATPRRRVRAGRSCRRARSRKVRLRVSLAPAGGHYDLQVRGRGRYRRLLSDTATTTFVYRARPGRRLRFRARARAASGMPGAFRASRLVRLRRVRCGRRGA